VISFPHKDSERDIATDVRFMSNKVAPHHLILSLNMAGGTMASLPVREVDSEMISFFG
jgi:hypothetical protein